MANDDQQQSVTLGLVAAKIALAEIEGWGYLKTAEQAFAAMRLRLNELIKADRKRSAVTTGQRETK